MVDDNLELEEDSFKFLVETLQKISSNCRQQYLLSGLVTSQRISHLFLCAGIWGLGKSRWNGEIWTKCQSFIGKTKVEFTLLDLVKQQNYPPITWQPCHAQKNRETDSRPSHNFPPWHLKNNIALCHKSNGSYISRENKRRIRKLTPLSTQISASKFQNSSQILPKKRGVWKTCGVWLKHSLKMWKLTQNFENSLKFLVSRC